MYNPLRYYTTPGPMTNPDEHSALFESLPCDVGALVDVVQGLLVHIFWADRYGLVLSEERQEEVQIRPIDRKLARILELDDRPLVEARPPERKLVGNCRDFSVTLCAMLRYQGVPARARCGFGTYFLPDHYEDHWVVEYWDATERRWVMVDSQLDAFQRQALGIDFDPLDMPPGKFVTGGQAWQMCRAGQADPDKFGIFEMHGLWFIRGDLIRDFLALNKVEILPWDHGWGFLGDGVGLEEEAMDRIAALSVGGDEVFAEVRSTYESDTRFHMPPELR
jgi:hypothetical protein